MTKILLLSYFSHDDEEIQRIFVGNEYSRDPSEMQQLISSTYRCKSTEDCITLDNELYSPEVQVEHLEGVNRILLRNGYTEHKPKRISI